ncbi:MAG: DUF3369 domain-containing protein [Magnetococcales bacterium]|nr:DUF3369 domain-containing protein [Magnetococcales bacterium]
MNSHDETDNISNEELLFADEPTTDSPSSSSEEKAPAPWKILIADDQPEVHLMTRLVLKNFAFEGAKLSFLSAHSGEEAQKLVKAHPDIAVLLLDVVMETETAGLDVVRYVRETLKNRFIRIVLRTGQPGQAPEPEVISEYDINDYKEKTDITDQKMITVITASLRGYRDLLNIEKNRKGLEKVVQATGSLFEIRSLKQLATGVLTQLAALLNLEESSLYVQPASGFAATNEEGKYILYAANGSYGSHIGKSMEEVVANGILDQLQQVSTSRQDLFSGDTFVGYFRTHNGSENLIYLKGRHALTETDQTLIRLFSTNVGFAFDNLYLNREILHTQRDVSFTLGEVIDIRSQEGGNHVRRVAESSRWLARLAGLSENAARDLWLASPMHDLGKIGVPDQILNKPGKLTDDEWQVMQGHAEMGRKILEKSNRKVFQVAAVIAEQHHERWDGNGYPKRLSGEEIHIHARITTLLDVFDTLLHDRCYREAWDMDKIVSLIKEERGQRFDPRLVDLLMDNLDSFLTIQEEYQDTQSSE